MDRIYVLDLGSSKAAVLAAELDEKGDLRIVAAASAPNKGVKKGIVVDLEEAQRSIEDAKRELASQLEESVEELLVSVGGSHVAAQPVQGFHPLFPRSRPVTRDDVLQVVNHSRKQIIPPDQVELQAIPQSFSIDGQKGICRPVGMSGSRLEVETLLVTGSRAHVQNLERAIELAGCRSSGFVLSSLASGLGALSEAELEHGAAVIDLGAGHTDVAVFAGGSIRSSASIPLGAASVTADIMKLLKTSPEEAERIKIKHGSAVAAMAPPDDSVGVMQLGQIHERPMQRRVLCEIIESRMKEIATFARQQLEKSGHLGLLPGGIVLAGGGALLPNTTDLISDLMPGHKVRVATPKAKGPAGAKIASPEWCNALGIARFAFSDDADELGPMTDDFGIGGKIRTIWSLLSGKA